MLRRMFGVPKQGFTLLELVIATVILTVGLVAIVRAYTRGMAATGECESIMTATLLAREKLAEFEEADELENGFESGKVSEPFEGYSWETEIEDLQYYENMKRVRIAILWARGQRERSVSFETLLYKAPMEEEEEPEQEEAEQPPAGEVLPSGGVTPGFGPSLEFGPPLDIFGDGSGTGGVPYGAPFMEGPGR